MKSGSLQFEFEVEVNRNILVLIQLTELVIVSVLKTSKNLEGTCHLLFCWWCFETTCLSAFEFSVYFYYYYYIWYAISSKLSFVDILRQGACELLNSLSTFTILFKILVCMYVRWLHAYVLTDPFLNLHLLPVVSAYLTPSSQLPSFPTNRYRIQQQYLPKMHLSFPFKRRELFNWRICFPVKYFTTELACHTICSCKYLLILINGVVVSDNLGISGHISEHSVQLHL